MKNPSSFRGVPVKFRVLAALAVVVCFAVFFQNCGMNMRFANMDGKLLAKSVQADDVNNDDGDNNELGEPSPTPSATPGDQGEPSPSPSATPGDSPSPTPTATADDGGPLTFVCVLEGPGQSVLLGYLDEALSASGNTPDTVCTTKRGCEEIVSQKFNVKEAVERDYCDHNKHVVKTDEATLRLLIGE